MFAWQPVYNKDHLDIIVDIEFKDFYEAYQVCQTSNFSAFSHYHSGSTEKEEKYIQKLFCVLTIQLHNFSKYIILNIINFEEDKFWLVLWS